MSSMTPTSISPTTRQIPWETRTVTRSQILEVANEILAREGAGSVSLGRVAPELGEKLPPLYEHFDSEDELLLCLAADVLLELTRELEGRRVRSPCPGVHLSALRTRAPAPIPSAHRVPTAQ